MIRPERGHTLWYAYLIHRISGLVLALFLPLHFAVLSFALTQSDQLDAFLSWSDQGIVKVAEFGLVFLLAIHMFGGLRLMALEWLPWSPKQKTFAALAAAGGFAVACTFFLSAVAT